MAGCNNTNTSNDIKASDDSVFYSLSDEYLNGYLSWRPLYAVALGFHENYDGKTTDYSRSSLDMELNRLKNFDARLVAIDTTRLSSKVFFDYRILRYAIKNDIFNFEDAHMYTHNPMTYASAIDVNTYVKRNFASLDERVKYIISTENALPVILVAAKANLEDSLPKPYIETAINITQGNASFLKGDLLTALKDLKNDTLMMAFKKANASAINAYNDFVKWLQKEKMPKSNNHFAIGRGNYKKVLLYNEDITLEPEKILAIGLEELKKEQAEFNAAAHIINPNKKPVDVYHDIQMEHPSADSLINMAKEHLESIRQYVIDHKICSMPSEVRVEIKETPQYARATSTASMDVAGPFEKKATESYYYITPVNATWLARQKEDWLRQFDFYTTDNVTIHEAYPGHYTQFLHLNASAATKLERIFGSYAFVEGWAHYCEKMMIEEGFGSDKDSVTAAKHRIAMSGDALLRICRLCVSIKIHCQGMSLDEGTKFFMDNWYQGEKPSYQEALRGTFDPGYLFYTVGKLEIIKLRNDYKQQEGSKFSLLKFHDMMLDNGMPPIKMLREILLKDKSKWNEAM